MQNDLQPARREGTVKPGSSLGTRTRRAAGLALVAALALAGCGSGPGGSGGPTGSTVTVAAAPAVLSAAVMVGVDKGIFGRHGLDVQADISGLGPTVYPRILSGQVQLGVNTWGTLVTAREQNLPLTGIAPVHRGGKGMEDDYQAIVARPGGPTSLRDLAGKVVGVPTLGSITDSQVRAALADEGVDVASVEFIALPFPDVPAALSSSRVDAAAVFEPYLTVATDSGAVPLAPLSRGQAMGAVVAAQSWVEQNADLVARFQTAWAEALAYCTDHPDDVRSVLVSRFKMDPAVAARIRLPIWQDTIDESDVQQIIDMMVRTGSAKSRLRAADLITPFQPAPAR
jgi:NitT/TauT family transport system substrate-binding protein